jgi:hypothetical protein
MRLDELPERLVDVQESWTVPHDLLETALLLVGQGAVSSNTEIALQVARWSTLVRRTAGRFTFRGTGLLTGPGDLTDKCGPLGMSLAV